MLLKNNIQKAVLEDKLLFLFKKICWFTGLCFLSFMSWNYFGALFFCFLYVLIKEVMRGVERGSLFRYMESIIPIIFAWHLGALFWMFYIDKGMAGFILNFFWYLIPFIVLFVLKKKMKLPIYIFIPVFVFFEFLNNTLPYLYPWVTVGNVMSNQWYLIQWYQLTSVLGGSVWLLGVVFLFFAKFKEIKQKILVCSLTVFIPVSISLFQYYCETEKPESNKRVITFNLEKYKGEFNNDELSYYLWDKLKDEKNAKTLFVPELTFRGLNHKNIESSLMYKHLKNIIKDSSIENLYIGSTIQMENHSIVNSGLFITNDNLYLKIKRKLVPYTEQVPIIMKFFLNNKKISYDNKSLDSQSYIKKYNGVCPLICYESIYPFFVNRNHCNGEVIYLISSEKFFNNSNFGRKQYNNLIRLRAIENRTVLIKSSSYGKSISINKKGDILKEGMDEFNYF